MHLLFTQQIHIPLSFKKDVLFPHCVADGIIGYSPEGVAKTWQVWYSTQSLTFCAEFY